jgi:SHS2 domain-containing protein
MYETFEHTADLGLRIKAPSVEGIFEEASEALLSVLVENPGEVRADPADPIRLEGHDLRLLLVDFLGELLRRFDAGGLLTSRCRVTLDGAGLAARTWGERADIARHRLDHEVKAVTYHGLRLERDGRGWLAEVIVDI